MLIAHQVQRVQSHTYIPLRICEMMLKIDDIFFILTKYVRRDGWTERGGMWMWINKLCQQTILVFDLSSGFHVHIHSEYWSVRAAWDRETTSEASQIHIGCQHKSVSVFCGKFMQKSLSLSHIYNPIWFSHRWWLYLHHEHDVPMKLCNIQRRISATSSCCFFCFFSLSLYLHISRLNDTI